MEAAQPPAGGPLTGAASHQATLVALERPGSGEEALEGLSAGSAWLPGPKVAQAQALAVDLALTARHRAGRPNQRVERGPTRLPVELLVADS